MSDVKTKAIARIAFLLAKPVEEIQTTLKFEDDLGADSLDMFELVMALEDEFEIEMDDGKIGKIATVQDAIDLIEETLRQTA